MKGKLPAPAKKRGKNPESQGGDGAIAAKAARRKPPFLGLIGEYWKLTRFEHALMLAVAVIIAEIIVLGTFPPLETLFFLTLIVPVFSEMGSFALNDYMDVEADRINKVKGRPLVDGTIKKQSAFTLSMFSFATSIVAAFFINLPALIIAVFYNLLAILYNTKLKDLPLAGNAFIATTMAIPFIFGAYAYSEAPSMTILAIALLGFISGLAREILKSTEDMVGDSKARGSKTLPLIIGREQSITVSGMLFLLFVPLTVVPFMIELSLGIVSGALLFLADVPILAIAFSLFYRREDAFLSKARKYSLAALFCGLLSLMLASMGF
ncbi:UbiA family prenyltransferase [Candidatus Micrarchaeota archaeon]|nr:UbiA family prenyltransferase [Candidatus Micrarchaeota archaeon]